MSRNSWSGGPFQVGSYKNYPYWRAPQVWGHFVKVIIGSVIVGAVLMLFLVQKHPDLRELKANQVQTQTSPKPAETVYECAP